MADLTLRCVLEEIVAGKTAPVVRYRDTSEFPGLEQSVVDATHVSLRKLDGVHRELHLAGGKAAAKAPATPVTQPAPHSILSTGTASAAFSNEADQRAALHDQATDAETNAREVGRREVTGTEAVAQGASAAEATRAEQRSQEASRVATDEAVRARRAHLEAEGTRRYNLHTSCEVDGKVIPGIGRSYPNISAATAHAIISAGFKAGDGWLTETYLPHLTRAV